MFIIGITGGTGSGKTTIVNEVINLFDASEICLLSSDSYYKNNASLDFNQRDKLNYDIPEAIDFDLLNKHIDLLKQEININVPNYCFTTHLRLEKTTLLSSLSSKLKFAESNTRFISPLNVNTIL